ncbi:sulfotransferase family protein [Acuticoccus yangtzensis]|uniref:sulfotransferase-like domain-containing protein n=1 Tax=Acuticoccus yangtzensis TaxID=1443441 RepID=UPI0009F8AB0C|nr:sulfotransferase family protein [Acuticoccus yangtzensis]
MNIAMWSGPRNLSTAMMYAFAARGDCAVWDEPFYGAYLAATGLDHPMGDAIMASTETDPAKVAAACAAPAASGAPHFYQKHMAHHMIERFDLGFMDALTHVFLIRHPARVLASYDVKRENPTLADIGYPHQTELYDRVRERTGSDPVVIDSTTIRADPAGALERLCRAIGLPFTDAMLSWPAGGHADDGVWAAHWYGAVHRSTGFAGAEGPLPEVAPHLAPVLAEALPHYERLKAVAI